jgi:hypothetical protein
VTQLVVRVVTDVLIHVFIENPEGLGKRRIAKGKLSVLLPQILLEKLGGGEETQNGYIARVRRTAIGPTGYSTPAETCNAGT